MRADEKEKFRIFLKRIRYALIKTFSAGISDRLKIAEIEIIVDRLINPEDIRTAIHKVAYKNIALVTKAMRRIKYNIRCANHADPPFCNKFKFASEILDYLMLLKISLEKNPLPSPETELVDFKSKKNLIYLLNLCKDVRKEFVGIKNLLVKILIKIFTGGIESGEEAAIIEREAQILVVDGMQEFFCCLSPATIEKMISTLQELQTFMAENVYGTSDRVFNSSAWKISQMFINYFTKLEAVIIFERFIDPPHG